MKSNTVFKKHNIKRPTSTIYFNKYMFHYVIFLKKIRNSSPFPQKSIIYLKIPLQTWGRRLNKHKRERKMYFSCFDCQNLIIQHRNIWAKGILFKFSFAAFTSTQKNKSLAIQNWLRQMMPRFDRPNLLCRISFV